MTGWRDARTLRRLAVAVTGVTGLASAAEAVGPSITEFLIPTPNSVPNGITAGPDGALWFTEQGGNKIGRITPAGVLTNGDGRADIVTGADAGGGPHVQVFSGLDLAVLRSFFAYDAGFLGGVRVGATDATLDGRADLETGAGSGGGPHVRGFDGSSAAGLANPIGSFFPFPPAFLGGVYVAGSP